MGLALRAFLVLGTLVAAACYASTRLENEEDDPTTPEEVPNPCEGLEEINSWQGLFFRDSNGPFGIAWDLQRDCDDQSFDSLQDQLDCYQDACANIVRNGHGEVITDYETVPFLYNGVCYTNFPMVPIHYDNDGSVEARGLTNMEISLYRASWDFFEGDEEGYDIYPAIECNMNGTCYMGRYTETGSRTAELELGVMCMWEGQSVSVE